MTYPKKPKIQNTQDSEATKQHEEKENERGEACGLLLFFMK
jgi:hypothetical protein